MTEHHDDLHPRLETLTTWPDAHAEPTLWKAALESAHEPRTLRMPPRRVLGIAAMVMLAAVGVWAAMGSLGQSRGVSRAAPAMRMAPSDADHVVAHSFAERAGSADARQRAFEPQPRAIQRSATMELTTADVRAVFDRLTALVEPARGEFVEAASAGVHRAEATLRVSAERLDALMRAIRSMEGVAGVAREELSAVDATDRRADLTARLANERRIEAELLALIDGRPGAPLGDVLKVRDALGEVRLTIEHLEAQRAALAERVALATLRVVVVPEADQPTPEPEAGGVLDGLREAFARGGRTLADSTAWLVEVLVGGLLLWVLLAVAGVWIVRALRWRATWA
jgi:hypothetical protein